ncbi:MAG: J domain-containing protein [Cyanobacteria bacterium SZAS-4]|nr:J domain-containing protein [Cyanobacteria bacterium SZAS-4]
MEEIKTIGKCFRVLDLPVTASLAEVKEAHRFLVQTFHEDKYPVDSPMRVKAMEKMIEINDAYHKLKIFFEKNPDGYTVKGGATAGGADALADDDDEMDWQTWQTRQESRADDAVKEWQEEEQVRRIKIKLEEERAQRKSLVNFGMIGAWLVVAVMWMGRGCTGTEREYYDDAHAHHYVETLNYKISMGTATTADYARLLEARNHRDNDAEMNNGGFLMVWLMAAGLCYVSVFPKPRRCIANWIESASFADPEATEKNDGAAAEATV